YLLSRFTLEQLVNVTRLQVEEESEMSLELLRIVALARAMMALVQIGLRILKSNKDDEVAWWVDSGATSHVSPYTPQQNGVAERKNRNLKEMVNSMLSYSRLKSRDAIFYEEWFTSIPRPRGMIQPSLSKIAEDEVEADKCVYSKFDASGKGVIICLYVDDMLIFGTDQDQVNKTKKFLSSKFDMKDLGEVEAILGIRIKRGNNDPIVKFQHNKGTLVSQLEYSKAIGFFFGNEAEWLRNLAFEISLWPKPISTISIRCDSGATLVKAYSQVYNGKFRNLGVRHSMIRKLIMNGVISVEFVRTQLNLFDHLTKGLARDLVCKAAIGIGLKST
nr:zinc finger, CCHC-type [Tanacetum cinerariifolium]